MPVKVVTFDCYGTLIDWGRGLCSAVSLERGGNRTSYYDFFSSWLEEQRHLIETYRPYAQIVQMATYLALSKIGIVLSPDELARVSASMGTWPPFEDAPRALAAVKGKVQLGVLSNVEDAVLTQSVSLLGTPFDFTVTAEQVKSYKPKPAHFTECLKRTGLPADQILHVGWYEYDVVPAHAAGMKTCWINREKRPRPSGPAPDFEIVSLDELPSVVSSLCAVAAA
jgi:2-haloacid dehalogenase